MFMKEKSTQLKRNLSITVHNDMKRGGGNYRRGMRNYGGGRGRGGGGYYGGGRGGAGRGFRGEQDHRGGDGARRNDYSSGDMIELADIPKLSSKHTPDQVLQFLKAFKNYCGRKYIAGLSDIFKNEGQAEYPSWPEPVMPVRQQVVGAGEEKMSEEQKKEEEDKQKWAMEKMKMDYAAVMKKRDRLEADKNTLIEDMLNRMEPSSVHLVNTVVDGPIAIRTRDPALLVETIRCTHIAKSTEQDPVSSFLSAQADMTNIRQRPTEDVTDYKDRYEGMMMTVERAAQQADAKDWKPLSEEMQTVHFVKSLHEKYSNYKHHVNSVLKKGEKPKTIQDAVSDAVKFGTNRGERAAGGGRESVFAAKKRPGGGRGNGGGDRFKVPDDSECNYCHELGHWKRDCPKRRQDEKRRREDGENQQIQRAVSEERQGYAKV